MDLARSRRFGRGAALVMGMAFAAGWTPCVGPILGVILTLAASTGSVAHGALLLLAYSLGLGVPFLLVALLFGSVKPLLGWLNQHSEIINKVAGATLIVIGILIFSGRLTVIAAWLTRILPSFGV
jgi:cytochrome c-type biogenesis protein